MCYNTQQKWGIGMPNDLAKQLKQIPLFAQLNRDDLKAVARLVQSDQYPAGSQVCHQGELGETAYFVESGQLSILYTNPQGIELEVGSLGPGAFVGETSLLLGEMRDATVTVVQDATLHYLNKDDFDQLLRERPWMLRYLQMRSDVARKRRARRFKGQGPDEIVLVSAHRHNAMLLPRLISPGFVFLVDLLGCGYWYLRAGSLLVLAIMAIPGLATFLFMLYLIMDHVDDIYIVTNKRVIRREQVPFRQESRVEAPLRNVQDIQESQSGLLAQVFDFGDLIIETAGERGHVAFREIPKTSEVKDIIFEQIRRMQAGAKAEERAAIRGDMQQYFGISRPEEKPSAPASSPKKRRFRLAVPKPLLMLVSTLTYFFPPMRHVQGDTITWRKHWITLLPSIAPPTLLIVLTTTAAIYALLHDLVPPGSILAGYVVGLVFLLPWWLWKFDDWQNDIYQVTASRIIDVERSPLFLREERREASLGRIQNIGLEIPGFLGRVLNYGSVTIETAGAGAFTFDFVKDPRAVQDEIFRRMETFHRQQAKEDAEHRRNELLDWFAVYDQIRRAAPPESRPSSSYPQET
jgi:uncharacterized membrane protein YdbT with pleckstrin-like domain